MVKNLFVMSIFVFASCSVLAEPVDKCPIENGRMNPEKYYDEKPEFVEHTWDMRTEGGTSLHFMDSGKSGWVRMTKFQWPKKSDFSAIAEDGEICFEIWFYDVSKIKNKITFVLGSRSNDKFVFWFIPAKHLKSRIWNTVRLQLKNGQPVKDGSEVNGFPFSKSSGAVKGNKDIKWSEIDYHSFRFPVSGKTEIYLDNCYARYLSDKLVPVKNKSVLTEEQESLPDCPEELMVPPEVSKDILVLKKPDIDFASIKDWTADFYNCEGQAYLSKKQGIRGKKNLRIEVRPLGENARVVLKPSEKIEIKHPFDTIKAWLHGGHLSGCSTRIKLNFLCPDGRKFSFEGGNSTFDLGGVLFCNWKLWSFRNSSSLAPAGTCLESIEIGPLNPVHKRVKAKTYVFTLDQMKFIKHEIKGTKPEFPNIGPEVKIPLTEDGALPQMKNPVRKKIYRDGKNFILEYKTQASKTKIYESPEKEISVETIEVPGENVGYIISPESGTFDDISVNINGKNLIKPAVQSGPVLIFDGKIFDTTIDKNIKRKLLSSEIRNNKVFLKWQYSIDNYKTVIDYVFELKGKTLCIDSESKNSDVDNWQFGHAEGLDNPAIVKTPFMMWFPNVLRNGRFFITYMPDWYVSNASTVPYLSADEISGDKAWYSYKNNSKYSYLSRTDGSRFPFRERFYITVSADYEEVLPTVNNPASPNKSILKKYLWLVHSTKGTGLPMVKKEVQQMIDFGMTKIYFIWHANFWNSNGGRGPEPFIGRMKNAASFEKNGGTDAVIKLYKWMRENGMKTGYYEGYNFMVPHSAYFSPDYVVCKPDGNWKPCYLNAYRCKPWAFPELCATKSKERAEKYGADVIYMDGWTANPLVEYNDYDHRFPENGRMKDTAQAMARAYRNLRKVIKGPVFSEGNQRHFIMAGIFDGSYGKNSDIDGKQPPLLPNFRLKKTQKLGSDLGMGCMTGLFVPRNRKVTVQDWYDFVCSEIVYANVGVFEPYYNISMHRNFIPMRFLSYFMIQQLQEQYMMEPVKKILYSDGKKYYETNKAISDKIYLNNMVFIEYENGLKIWANFNREGKTWKVAHQEKKYTLPRGGWLAVKPDVLLEYSALIDGRRMDFSDGINYTYIFAGTKPFKHKEISIGENEYLIIHKKGPLAGKKIFWSRKEGRRIEQ